MRTKTRVDNLERDLKFTQKRLSNLSIDVQTAFASLANHPEVETMTNKQLLDAIFESLVRVKE